MTNILNSNNDVEPFLNELTPEMVSMEFEENLTRSNEWDAGSDIRSAESKTIKPWQRELFCTRLRVAVPKGHVGLILSRSGLAVRHGIEVGAGVIDAPYRGELKVMLMNFSNEPYSVLYGDRIAQMVIIPVNLIPWKSVSQLNNTTRGSNGFGSSGR